MAAAGDNSYKVTIMTCIADIKVARWGTGVPSRRY